MTKPDAGTTQRVLVVDDDPSVRSAHARIIESLGYEAEVASDGIEALTKLALGIDLVLLDLYMPNMDGFEVAAAIRSLQRSRRIPIIFMSANEDRRRQPRPSEDEHYFRKPLVPSVLRAKVLSLLPPLAAVSELQAAASPGG